VQSAPGSNEVLYGLRSAYGVALEAVARAASGLLGAARTLDAEARESVHVVQRASQQLRELTDELADLTDALVGSGYADAASQDDAHDAIDPLERRFAQAQLMREFGGYAEVAMDELLAEVHAALAASGSLRSVSLREDCRGFEQAVVCLNRPALQRVLRVLGRVALEVTPSGEVTCGARLITERRLLLWIAADGFAANATDPGQLVFGGATSRVRMQRAARVRMSIAQVLLSRLSSTLIVQQVEGRAVLAFELPVAQRISGGFAPSALPTRADLALAQAYLAALGHDLRSPLNAIVGFSELLALGQSRDASTDQVSDVQRLRELALDVKALVEDAVAWAELAQGQLEIEPQLTAAEPLLTRTAAELEARSGSRGLHISLALAPGLPSVRVDEPRFVQALSAALDWAIRAEPGPALQLSAQRSGPDHVQLSVTTLASPHASNPEPALNHKPVIFTTMPCAPDAQGTTTPLGPALGRVLAERLLAAQGGEVGWVDQRDQPSEHETTGAALAVTLPSESPDASAT